ncbi:hypothetical protein [Endothiovibrio diazotrophicus]
MIGYLIELAAVDTNDVVHTLYFSDGSVHRPFPPSDPDRPRQVYLPRIVDVAIGQGGRDGTGGEVVLTNADGALSHLYDWAFDGRRIEVRRGEWGTPWAGWEVVLVGIMEMPRIAYSKANPATITLPVKDRRGELEVALQDNLYSGDNVYLGDNVGPIGDEGTADDLKDQPKPIVIGSPLNVPGRHCNTIAHRIQLHDGVLTGLNAARDEEIPLTYTSGTPTGGEYSVDLASGIVTLGTDPVGTATFDPVDATTQTAAGAIRAVTSRVWGSETAASLDQDALDTLDLLTPYTLGLYLDSEVTVTAVIDRIMDSLHGWWDFDADGRLTCGLRYVPESPAGTVWQAHHIEELERIVPNGMLGQLVYRVEVRYARNHTPRRAMDNGATAERRAWAEQEWRTAVWEDTSIRDRHPSAEVMTIDTALVTRGDADMLAGRLRMLYSVQRTTHRVTVPRELTGGLRRGSMVEIHHPQLGSRSGGTWRVEALLPDDPQRGLTTVTVWG